MTPAKPDLGALRAMVERATPGEWLFSKGDGEGYVEAHSFGVIVHGIDPVAIIRGGTEEEDNANGALICAAANALPALLRRLEGLERVAECAREHYRFRQDAGTWRDTDPAPHGSAWELDITEYRQYEALDMAFKRALASLDAPGEPR